jgi:STE20-related kinase adapter protein alpha
VRGAEIFVVSPMSSLGSVRDVLDVHFPSGLPEQAVALVLRDVLRALEYLHSKKVGKSTPLLNVEKRIVSNLSLTYLVHRSVRASHILLSSSGSARLTGLRYACHLTEPGQPGLQDRYDYDLHVAKTNLCWLSPEFLQQASIPKLGIHDFP